MKRKVNDREWSCTTETTQAEDNIINAASFKGIDGGLESGIIEIQGNSSEIWIKLLQFSFGKLVFKWEYSTMVFFLVYSYFCIELAPIMVIVCNVYNLPEFSLSGDLDRSMNKFFHCSS